MFKNSYKLLFMLTLMMGSLITISSNSWLSAWMGLEINLLSFIPLMNDSKNLMSSESSLKYFLIQALASATLLFTVIIFLFNYNDMLNSFSNKMINMMIISSLMLKSGMAPFHFWFPAMIDGLNWVNSFILLTWQKIAPLMLLSYMMMEFLFIPIILSMIVGSLGGLNQTSIRKIMAYSSINHIGWMVAAMTSSNILWMNYFLFYSFLSITLIYFFNFNKLFFMNQLYSMYLHSNSLKMILFMNFLSLGGLPPFLGFYPKWMVIQNLTDNNQLFMMTTMVMITLVTLFYYIRICYASFMMNYFENKWNMKFMFKLNNMLIYLILSFISIFGLIMINLLFMIL